MDVNASLQLRGQFESPRLTGRITVAGGEINVDRILDRAVFRPYSTEEAALPVSASDDAMVALNPWDRLGLDIELLQRFGAFVGNVVMGVIFGDMGGYNGIPFIFLVMASDKIGVTGTGIWLLTIINSEKVIAGFEYKPE